MAANQDQYFSDHLEACDLMLSSLLLLDKWTGDSRANLDGALTHLDQALFDVLQALETSGLEGDERRALDALIERRDQHDDASGERYEEWVRQDDQRTLVGMGHAGADTLFAKSERCQRVNEEAALQRTLITIETLLKIFLIDRGFDDRWLYENVGHDLQAALEHAERLGLRLKSSETGAFMARLNPYYISHNIGDYVRRSDAPISELDMLVAAKEVIAAVLSATANGTSRLQ